MEPGKEIRVDLDNGYKLVITRNHRPYDKEFFIGLMEPDGMYGQELVLIRNKYEYDNNDNPIWNNEQFEVLVYGDGNDEDWTNEFIIHLRDKED